MITRRDLLVGILTAGISPAIVRAGSIMRIRRPIVPVGYAILLDVHGRPVHVNGQMIVSRIMSADAQIEFPPMEIPITAGGISVVGPDFQMDDRMFVPGGGDRLGPLALVTGDVLRVRR